MNNRWSKVPALLAIIAGALIIIAPLSFAGPCRELLELKAGGLVAMKCYWTARIFVVIGALIVLTGILQLFAKNQETQRLLSVIIIAQAVALLLIPRSFVIGICGMDMAACHYLVKVETVLTGFVLLAGLANIIGSNSKTSLENNDHFNLG